MDNVKEVGVSLNDVVGHPSTIEKHGNHPQNVFNITTGLRRKLKISKSEIVKSIVKVLGYNLGAEESEVDPRSLEAIQKESISD